MAGRIERQNDGNTDGLLTKILKDITVAHDWLAGPGMTERDRVTRDAAEAQTASSIRLVV